MPLPNPKPMCICFSNAKNVVTYICSSNILIDVNLSDIEFFVVNSNFIFQVPLTYAPSRRRHAKHHHHVPLCCLKTRRHRPRSKTSLPHPSNHPLLPRPLRHPRPPHLRRRPLLRRLTHHLIFLLSLPVPLPPPPPFSSHLYHHLASDRQLQLIFFTLFVSSFLAFVNLFQICCSNHSRRCGHKRRELLQIGDGNKKQKSHISGPAKK